MRKWLVWIREHREDWPTFLSFLILLLNVEIVVTPYILAGLIGLHGEILRRIAGVWSTAEMCWWIYFSVWLTREKMENVGKSKLRDVFKTQESDHHLLIKAKKFFRKHILENFDLENYKGDKLFKIISKSLRDYGYLTNCFFIFIFSLLPGYWILALMMSRITKWTSLYLVLLVGNFLKNYFLAYVYELIGFWWLLVVTTLVLVAVGFVVKRSIGRIGQKL